MTDIMSAAKRSALMQRIRSKNTTPERVVRSALHSRGLRYRLHTRVLGTRPDLVFRSKRIAVFVHGCFWHGHDCHLFRLPKSQSEFWRSKISGNRQRDRRVTRTLLREGWCVATVWECALRQRTREQIDHALTRLENWIRTSRRAQKLTLRGR